MLEHIKCIRSKARCTLNERDTAQDAIEQMVRGEYNLNIFVLYSRATLFATVK